MFVLSFNEFLAGVNNGHCQFITVNWWPLDLSIEQTLPWSVLAYLYHGDQIGWCGVLYRVVLLFAMGWQKLYFNPLIKDTVLNNSRIIPNYISLSRVASDSENYVTRSNDGSEFCFSLAGSRACWIMSKVFCWLRRNDLSGFPSNPYIKKNISACTFLLIVRYIKSYERIRLVW